MTLEEEVAQLRIEVERLRAENAGLKAQGRLDKAAVHIHASSAPEQPGSAVATVGADGSAAHAHARGRAAYTPPEVVAALRAAAEDKSAVDADLATATAWVGAAFMEVGKRFASGGMRDRDVPHKPGHTNMNLGGGTITLAQMEACLAELAKDASGVLEMYDPYQNYGWQSGDASDVGFGIAEPREFPDLKGKIVDPDGGGTHKGPFALFQQRMMHFGGDHDPEFPDNHPRNYFSGGYGRNDVPHVHIPVPQPDTPPEPAVIQVNEGMPLQYADFMGVGVRMVHPCNPRAPARNLGYSYLYVPPHVVQEPGGHEVEEAYICLKGEGYIYLNGKKQVFTPNTWVWLPPWTEHGIDNTGNETMEILVMSGPPNP